MGKKNYHALTRHELKRVTVYWTDWRHYSCRHDSSSVGYFPHLPNKMHSSMFGWNWIKLEHGASSNIFSSSSVHPWCHCTHGINHQGIMFIHALSRLLILMLPAERRARKPSIHAYWMDRIQAALEPDIPGTCPLPGEYKRPILLRIAQTWISTDEPSMNLCCSCSFQTPGRPLNPNVQTAHQALARALYSAGNASNMTAQPC